MALSRPSPRPQELTTMKQHGRWRCTLALGILTSISGCATNLNVLDGFQHVAPEAGQPDAACAKDHVYIFFNHGMDPLDFANLGGVRDYVQSLGYHKTYYGKLCPDSHFDHEICRIHKEDPCAHFVLLGFSFGANRARDVAQAVKNDGIKIDLLVYLGGNTLRNVPRDQPENVCRMINILANGCIWNGDHLERAENIQVDHVWHFGSPSHPYTLELLARELAALVTPVADASAPERIPAPQPED
jgi:hypothetical protein